MTPTVAIKSLAFALPKRRIKNTEPPYSEIPDVPEGWWDIWGTDNRGVIDLKQAESVDGLAAAASREALELAGIVPSSIDLIIANTSVAVIDGDGGRRASPRLGPALRERLGAWNALAWDVEQECMSYLLGWQIAANFLTQGRFKNALLCSAEHSTSVMDFTEPTATIFGDGAAAAVLTAEGADAELLAAAYGSNSSNYRLATVDWRFPLNMPEAERRPEDFWTYFTIPEDAPEQMQMFVPFVVPQMVNQALEAAGLCTKDIDFYVFHQPSQLLVSLWAAGLEIEPDRYSLNMGTYGCMISASMPVTLHQAIASGKVKPGSKVVIAGAAIGWGYGAQVWRWGETRVLS